MTGRGTCVPAGLSRKTAAVLKLETDFEPARSEKLSRRTSLLVCTSLCYCPHSGSRILPEEDLRNRGPKANASCPTLG